MNAQAPETVYSERKLVDRLNQELLKEDINYSTCRDLMQNLGQLSAGKEKEVDDELYYQLFQCITMIFRNADTDPKIPLSLRILSLKVLMNSCLVLHSRQHTNISSTAYSNIIKEIDNEVKKPNYSAPFLMTIIDCIYTCARAQCIDDKATVQGLLSLKQIINSSLRPINRESLSLTLDVDLAPFNEYYKYGAHAREINNILSSLGCKTLIQDVQTTFESQIPPPFKITTLEEQLAAQEFLLTLSPLQLAERVIEGFKKFKRIDNYIPPDTIEELLTVLIEGPEEVVDAESTIKEAAIYMVEQALDRLNLRAAYIPLQCQAEFISMLIGTYDSSVEGFEECTGPATLAAMKRAIEPDQVLVQFLVEWATFEFVRSPKKRYETLVINIFKNLVEIAANTDLINVSPILDPAANVLSNQAETEETSSSTSEESNVMKFIKNLEYLPDEIYPIIQDLCKQYPNYTSNILDAFKEYSAKAQSSLSLFLDALLSVCEESNPLIYQPAIGIITIYYKRRQPEIVSIIDEKAKEFLQKSLTAESIQSYVDFFFTILENNMSLFMDLLDAYSNSQSNDLRKSIKDKLRESADKMHYDVNIVKELFNAAAADLPKKDKTVLIHLYLYKLSEKSRIPSNLVDPIKNQFKLTSDARYLIPIVPYLSEEEFKSDLPSILSLPAPALSKAINGLFTTKKPPMSPDRFLIEIHKPRIAKEMKEKAVYAMQICLSEKYFLQYFPYDVTIRAVNVIVNNKYHDMIMETLLQITTVSFKNLPKCIKYVLNTLLHTLVNNGITSIPTEWEVMKELIMKTTPTSYRPVLMILPYEQIKDLIDSNQDIKKYLRNTAEQMKTKHAAKIHPAVLELLNS